MSMLILLLAFVGVSLASLCLKGLNLRYQMREGTTVPPELAGAVDAERLARIAAYTRDRARFAMVTEFLRDAGLAVFLFGGVLGAYDAVLGRVGVAPLARGVLFFVGLTLGSALLSIPFSLYSSFRIEARHGFNRMSPQIFWGDWLKGTTLSVVFVALLSTGALWLVRLAPHAWWLYVWALFVAASVLITLLTPSVIEPLFFHMKPLHVPGLEQEVRALAERAGVHVSRVLEVDASRRSTHSNAYFAGIGSAKRVVLFDTLFGHMSHGEILAILAHELGHWRKHHVLSRTLWSFAVALGALYLAFRFAPTAGLPSLVGLADASFPARLFILGVIASVALFPITPLASYWSRRHEWQADAYATELQRHPEDLASALTKLASENLSNLHPHPLYAAFYYSHPPMPERIRSLRAQVHGG
ncbi:MAG TPA: M48 family metallopeptidase [Polyangiaceae bacterium]|nr:M48 family metallopeptidase [Polyangiaceae bacterium]